MPHTPRKQVQRHNKPEYAHGSRETVSSIAAKSRETESNLLAITDEQRAGLDTLQTRVFEVKEEVVNSRQTLEKHCAKQIEITRDLKGNLDEIKESVSSAQSSVMSLRLLGSQIMELYFPRFHHSKKMTNWHSDSINSFPLEVRGMLRRLLYVLFDLTYIAVQVDI